MDTRSLTLRNLTYSMFVELGRAPTAVEVGDRCGVAPREVEEVWRSLHAAHALVLTPGTAEIRMANPFSAVPTAYRVHAADRWWYGNCAWDAFGICAALGTDGEIETSCPDCGDPIAVEVVGRQPEAAHPLLFHCLVPAARWWKDIVYT